MKSFLGRLFKGSTSSLFSKTKQHQDFFAKISDDEFKSTTAQFKQRVENSEPLFSLLPEVFACGMEASFRSTGMRHYDVQLQGAIELARGNIVEMKTGEGKTLVATLPAYLYSLLNKGVHVITVNDYLARRDAEWMGQIYSMLGLSTGCITEDKNDNIQGKKAAYNSDITYATNSELVFDLLRDKLVDSKIDKVQRELHFAIIDEIDLILLDEAQTPLVISGEAEKETEFIKRADKAIKGLKAEKDYQVDHKTRTASLTDAGLLKIERFLNITNLSQPENINWFHAVYQSLQAHAIHNRDVDYIIEDGEIFLVDEHTGRVSYDKRYSDGLHQAIEAKEGLDIQGEDTTLAKISYQHFFLSYNNFAGMTGTAHSERDEFLKVYGKRVKRIATNKKMIRQDLPAMVYASIQHKHQAVVEHTQNLIAASRPVLIGTVSIRESEYLSKLFHQHSIKHKVLNAKNHEHEADIISNAGKAGNVTISTNMAGRGTDILLDENARQSGGLAVIGTGEHESVRLDNQLRGRAGRQGDPGSSVFMLSPDDQIYKHFGQTIIPSLISRLDHTNSGPILDRHTLSILRKLKDKVEIENRHSRIDLFKYDSVLNEKRNKIWQWRESLLEDRGNSEWEIEAEDIISNLLENILAFKIETQPETEFNWHNEIKQILATCNIDPPEISTQEEAFDLLYDIYRKTRPNTDKMQQIEQQILLSVLDRLWPEFLTNLERVEDSVGLRGYGSLDPLIEYKNEANRLFGELLINIARDTYIFWLKSVS